MQVIINNLAVSYLQQGKGRHVVLVHGWGDNFATFTELAERLSSDFTVTSIDLPGFGSSQPPDGIWGLHEYALLLRDFLQKLDVNPHALVGHSNGGAVIIKAVSNGIITTEKLILLAAAGIRDQEKLRKITVKALAKVGKIGAFWLSNAKKRKLQKKLYGVVGSDMLVAPHLKETFKRTVKEDVQKDAEKISTPTLLIYGEDDKATPPFYGRIYQQLIKNSILVTIPKSGHFVHQDALSQVAREIKGFIK
jgi:pimeloyl-ACP methyl ester carboxylesterase